MKYTEKKKIPSEGIKKGLLIGHKGINGVITNKIWKG